MKITKFEHCCALIEEKGVRILVDPGSYSIERNDIKNIDVILITHEHHDHLHIDFLKQILKNNPKMKIFTNSSVGQILDKEGIKYELLENKQSKLINDVLIEGVGEYHENIYRTLPKMKNVGYFISGRLFYPGDAFTVPNKKVEILAAPVGAPWLKIEETIDYIEKIKPEVCFPVHDGTVAQGSLAHRLPKQILEPLGIKFVVMPIGEEVEL